MCGKSHVRRGRYEGSLMREDLRTLSGEQTKDIVDRYRKQNTHVMHVHHVSDCVRCLATAKHRHEDGFVAHPVLGSLQ
jgi:hypothetical protein